MGSSQAAVSFLSKTGRAALSLGAAALGLGAAATAVNSSLCTVDVGHRAVVFNRFRGILEETVGEGTHFLIPSPIGLGLYLGMGEYKKYLTLTKLARLRRQEHKRQANEEKIMQREREKERIEAGKKLLEAQRIGEENERKRFLALRKAAEEAEERRARENVIKKLEQDKERIEAKRIAEENERKRILALRKAAEEKEEKKRATENILKKLEQDKERIEADKKLLEAKRIAEENERKRILGLRKAAAAEEENKKLLEAKRIAEENERKRILGLRKAAAQEEEKRARENILKKIEQDKLNRRSELGLPLDQATVRSPAIAVKQEKISKPVYTTTKVEHLRECLRSLKRQHQDENERVQRAFETLLVYVGNVVKNPMEEKYRKIRLSNPLFQDRVGSLNGGVEFLELCGFERRGDFLYLPREKVDVELLTKAGSVLNSAMTNPFFGLLSKVS